MIPLKTICQNALDNLAALITEEATGIVRVYVDPDEAINELPCLVLFDAGMKEARPGNSRREIEWDLRLNVLAQIGQLRDAVHLVRNIRADLIDKLGEDITLSGAVARTSWKEPLRLASLWWQSVEYAGVDGLYTLWINDSRTFS